MPRQKTKEKICKNCYNKGYSTEMIGGTITYGDFVGDKTFKSGYKTLYHFCNCERGKDIAKMVESIKRQARAEAVKEIIEDYKNGLRCLNCGAKKGESLSDWCGKCMANA